MDKSTEEATEKFISALIKSVQTLCHGYLHFQDGVEIIGHINLSVDSGSRVHYILEEKVCKNEENSTLFISDSFHALNPKLDSKGKDLQNAQSGTQVGQRHESSDNEGGTVSSAISSITTALTASHEKSRSGPPHAKHSDSMHSKPNTAKRKASEDHGDVRAAKSSHLSSSPSLVSHFLSGSPQNHSGPSSPTDIKPSVSRQTRSESNDGDDGDLNLAASVLERVDDQSNSDLQDRTEDSDGDLEVTFIKEEYVEGEHSSCQYDSSGGQYGRGTRQRGATDSLSDQSLFPSSLQHSAPATFVPSALGITQQYGPSTSSSQPGPSGGRGLVHHYWVPEHEALHGQGMANLYHVGSLVRNKEIDVKYTGVPKRYQCTLCDYSNNRMFNFQRHMRRHTGEMFECELCGVKYNCKYMMAKHKRKDHSTELNSPHCTVGLSNNNVFDHA